MQCTRVKHMITNVAQCECEPTKSTQERLHTYHLDKQINSQLSRRNKVMMKVNQ